MSDFICQKDLDSMGPIPATIIGAFVFVTGLFGKVLLGWEDFGPAAPRERRGRALFQCMYLGPDLALFTIGLMLSSAGLLTLLSQKNVVSPLGKHLSSWYGGLMAAYICSLLLTVVLWFIAGERKYIPIEDRNVRVRLVDGSESMETVSTPDWLRGLFCKAGRRTLLGGNAVGLACLFSYVWFIVNAF